MKTYPPNCAAVSAAGNATGNATVSVRSNPGTWRAVVLAALLASGAAWGQERCVVDDAQREVCLDAPAQRIVALSPGATELLFAAGAGERIVGTVSFSDHPEAARDIARIGSDQRLDLERLLASRPDLVVAWITGNPTEQVERIEALGVPVYRGEQLDFEDVATTLERYGRLAGTEVEAAAAAAAFREGIAAIGARYGEAEPVRFFYQIWDEPLMTVNGEHLISQAARLCAGVNVFGDLDRLAPRVDVESVLAAQPEVIAAGGMGEADDGWLRDWQRYGELTAVRRGNLFFIPPSTLQRPTPRLLEGVALLCEQLERARERR